ncbi:Putative serine/threonine-protein kinase receptor [Glycine soja]|uniref:Putative serine/threonine-protein kinase receptor n=1 Tax=Glycine soja TaxID=3848 RepID=A0A0B2R7C1_GLYSO|nr:Putative serine/threonine-protein kinase receptor [Glycine soja]
MYEAIDNVESSGDFTDSRQVGSLGRLKKSSSECFWLKIRIGVARGLHYLHAGVKLTIIHLHINLSNILLDNNMKPKIKDFSLSLKGPHFMSKPKPIKVVSVVGTYAYMAMEYAMYGTVKDKCDVMGEVEVELESALLLQEQADITNISSNYTLYSTTNFPKYQWPVRWTESLNSGYSDTDTEQSIESVGDLIR